MAPALIALIIVLGLFALAFIAIVIYEITSSSRKRAQNESADEVITFDYECGDTEEVSADIPLESKNLESQEISETVHDVEVNEVSDDDLADVAESDIKLEDDEKADSEEQLSEVDEVEISADENSATIDSSDEDEDLVIMDEIDIDSEEFVSEDVPVSNVNESDAVVELDEIEIDEEAPAVAEEAPVNNEFIITLDDELFDTVSEAQNENSSEADRAEEDAEQEEPQRSKYYERIIVEVDEFVIDEGDC